MTAAADREDCDPATPDNDLDDDGHDHRDHGGDDCDDADAGTYPGAQERCDYQDNDCDGDTDEGLSCGSDDDGDGYTENDGDCNDNDPQIHPGVTELCTTDV